MKRFYTMVTTVQEPQGFAIHLDGKPVRLSMTGLVAPNAALAELVAGEWAAQMEKIDPETMPLTQIVTTITGQDETAREAIAQSALAYLDTDLLCYRAEIPEALAARQAATWDPWIGWFETQSGVQLLTTTQLTALRQPREAHEFVQAEIAAMDFWRFNILQMVTALSGSLVLGLAFCDGAASADDVFNAAHVEEIYRAEFYNEALYGQDPHQEKTQAAKRRDLTALRQVLDTLA